MIGTFINVATVLLGAVIGLILKTKLPERIVKTVFQAVGLFTLAVGAMMFLKINAFLVVIFSLIVGAIIGELIDIERNTETFVEKIKLKFSKTESKFTEGLLTAFLLFCMGSMTILGAFEEGTKGDSTLLITKVIMDGFGAMALSSAFGAGVAFSVIPLFVYQGGLTLAAHFFGKSMPEILINDLSATGGVLLLGLGLKILEIKNIKVMNLLPALVFALLFSWLNLKYFT